MVKDMEFMVGCNYWASNAGVDMWRQFDADCVDRDLRLLSEHGVRYIRAFPLWRDFQPIIPTVGIVGRVSEYRADTDRADNPYYLDETMMDRFARFLDICDTYKVRVIVGLVTGWMSGGLFTPPALFNKNVITDPVSQHFQQLFIRGFIERFRDRDAVYAWDLGNECNCMAPVQSRFEAVTWVGMVSNAIRAADPSRPIVSGMHGLTTEGAWTIQDQGMYTDILTTHPYPYWCDHTRRDETCSLRTSMHATAQSKYYADIGKKPCLTEEIGTMGPMVCSDERAAEFMRLNLFSIWANGGTGVMWWCGHDQTELTEFPYSLQMVERELGMLDIHYQPKPVLLETKRFTQWVENDAPVLPAAKTDAVCVLTRGQDQWGMAYMTHILTQTCGLNCRFAYGDDVLPDSPLYILPSVNGLNIFPKNRYNALLDKVRDGADLYVSIDDAVFSEFQSFSGLKVIDSYNHPDQGYADVAGEIVHFERKCTYNVRPTTATVLVSDDRGNPFITVNTLGKGRVFFVNAPIEQNLLSKHEAFDATATAVYRLLFRDKLKNKPFSLSDEQLVSTYHPTEDGGFAVILNHYHDDKAFILTPDDGYAIDTIYYGSTDCVCAYDACVVKLKKT